MELTLEQEGKKMVIDFGNFRMKFSTIDQMKNWVLLLHPQAVISV